MMGSSSKNVRISQEGFDALVIENIHDLGMDPAEALADAIETLKLQGVDLSGIVKCVPGVSNAKENPVVLALDALRDMTVKAPHLDEFVPDVAHNASIDIERVGDVLATLRCLCSAEGSENVSIARNNGGVEVLISICAGLPRHVPEERALVLSLKMLAVLVHDDYLSARLQIPLMSTCSTFSDFQCAETFKRSDGPKVVMGILNEFDHNINILNSGFAVVAAAASGNEILKEAFMELNIDELLVQLIVAQNGSNIQSLFDALRVLLTPDDTRVLASQTEDSRRSERMKASMKRKYESHGRPTSAMDATFISSLSFNGFSLSVKKPNAVSYRLRRPQEG
ncbi:Armadillo repeat-containing protein 6 [Nymphaea thermarum]|nr:Armadillo repeat-containing protein 6 [Nymphaea thermarum]